MDERFRESVRSKILDRIYNKNILQREQEQQDDAQNEQNSTEFLKKPLSKDWNRTLSRLLKSTESGANRRDAIDFFIKRDNNKPEDEERPTAQKLKKKRRKSNRPKVEVIEEFTKRDKTRFNADSKSTLKILANSGRIEQLHEEFPIPTNYLERYALLDPWNYNNTIRYLIKRNSNSWIYRFISWMYSFIFPHDTIDDEEHYQSKTPGLTLTQTKNNARPTFQVADIELVVYQTGQMNDFEKQIGKLVAAYDRYQESVSGRYDKNLNILERIIEDLLVELENISPSSSPEVKLRCKTTLRSVHKKRQEFIFHRRKSLLNLLQIWEKITKQNKTIAKLVEKKSLDLELIEDTDSDDQNLLNKESQLIKKILDILEDDPQEKIFLRDGRLSGEPRFKSVKLVFDFKVQVQESNCYICRIAYNENQISTVSQTEPLKQNSLCQRLKSSRILSVLFPPHLWVEDSTAYRVISTDKSSNTESECFKPTISIFEVIKSGKQTREELLEEFSIENFIPSWRRSQGNPKKVEINIGNREQKFQAKLTFNTFWSCVTSSNIKNQDSCVLNSEKRKLENIETLSKLEEILHNLRFLGTPSLDLLFELTEDPSEEEQTNFKIGLVEQILRKKFDLETEERRKNILLRRKEVDQSSKESLPDGQFCSDEWFDANKRYEMFVYRNTHQTSLRFIPLTNFTEKFFTNVLSQQNSHLESVNTLVEFLRNSSNEHLKRIQLPKATGKRRKQSSASVESEVFNSWIFDSDSRILKNWIQVVQSAVQKLAESDSKKTGSLESQSMKYEDIVREPEIESIEETSIFSALTHILFGDNRRKLNPSHKTDRKRRTILATEAVRRELQFILSIHSVSGIVMDALISSRRHDDVEDFDEEPELFVEVRVDDNNEEIVHKSSLIPASHATWNENFRFSTRFYPEKKVQISLFALKKNEEHDESGEEFDQIWLGKLEVPLCALILNSKLEGSFQMVTPYFVNFKDDFPHEDGEEDSTLEAPLMGVFKRTSLSLFLTSDPLIETTNRGVDCFKNLETCDSIESPSVIEHCQRWHTTLAVNYPERRFVSLLKNSNGSLVLAPRFIAPFKPPELEDLFTSFPDQVRDSFTQEFAHKKGKSFRRAAQKEKLYERALVRYVSLISHRPRKRYNEAKSSIHTCFDSLQFLSARIGYICEHAILLACWLQFLGRNAFVLFGNSPLEETVALVIVFKHYNEQREATPTLASSLPTTSSSPEEFGLKIIDPRRGIDYSVRDIALPINAVHCILTPDNVYANIQKNAHPSAIQYNLQKSSQWSPLFTSKDLHSKLQLDPIRSIQPMTIRYSSPDPAVAIQKLESKIETFIRDELMRSRRAQWGTFTAFNRACSQTVRELLPQIEAHCLVCSSLSLVNDDGASSSSSSSSTSSMSSHIEALIEETVARQLEDITTVHDLIGYPLNIPFDFTNADNNNNNGTSFEQIASLVSSSGLASISGSPDNNNNNSKTVITTSSTSSKTTTPAHTIEYIVSVYIHNYVGNVNSVWAYIGVLLPKANNNAKIKKNIAAIAKGARQQLAPLKR